MPRAEAGTTKAIANQLKSKGLQRLRWWCEPCQKQCRDENGYRMHCSSEGHVRNMLIVGENAKKHIDDYSSQFKSNFLHLLKTAHGTKMVHANHFYQEYISDKQHVHMNSTKYHSLTEFVKFLGRQGLCKVEEGERGLEIAWIDNSPEALRRADTIRKQQKVEKADEELEQRLIKEQIARAQRDAEGRAEEIDEAARELRREDSSKIILNFKSTLKSGDPQVPTQSEEESAQEQSEDLAGPEAGPQVDTRLQPVIEAQHMGATKPKNIFATTSKKKAALKQVIQRPVSEAERIMKEELERKGKRVAKEMNAPPKRQRV